MKQTWRLLTEFRPGAEPGNDKQTVRWIRNTLEELGVSGATIERLEHHLAETALESGASSVRAPPSASCQVYVPARGQPARCRQQDWACFLVVRPADRPGSGDPGGRPTIQIFLYPATLG